MEFVQKKKYNVDILNLKTYNEVNIYPCHFCHSVSDIWSYTDGKRNIHLCPSCSLELSDQIYLYFEKNKKASVASSAEEQLTPWYYNEEDDVKLDEDELRRELAMAHPR